jgi:tetratricopeptide (TPR) repeat protein
MKILLPIFIIIFLLSIDAFAQRENKTLGRGQESGLTERINRNLKNHGLIDPQQRTIARTPKLINESSPRRQAPKGTGVPIEGDGSGFCTVISPGDVIIVDNGYKPSFLELALQSMENENFGGAIQLLNSAIENEPFNAELYFLRGKAYLEIGNYILAKRDFSTVNVLEPLFSDAYYFRGLSNLYLGDKKLAVEDFKIAASLGDTLAENFLLKYSN